MNRRITVLQTGALPLGYVTTLGYCNIISKQNSFVNTFFAFYRAFFFFVHLTPRDVPRHRAIGSVFDEFRVLQARRGDFPRALKHSRQFGSDSQNYLSDVFSALENGVRRLRLGDRENLVDGRSYRTRLHLFPNLTNKACKDLRLDLGGTRAKS